MAAANPSTPTKPFREMKTHDLRREVRRRKIGNSTWTVTAHKAELLHALETGLAPSEDGIGMKIVAEEITKAFVRFGDAITERIYQRIKSNRP